MYYNEYLQHHGIKGMRWGHRKTYSKMYQNMIAAKKQKKQDYIDYYTKCYQWYERASNPFAATKSGRDKTEILANQMETALNKYLESKSRYKDIKKEYENQIKSAYKDINSKTSIGGKMLFGSATRKQAAKYIVNNNMSVADAKKKANEKAIRNTLTLLSTVGGLAVGAKIVWDDR